MLSMSRVSLAGTDALIACGFTNGVIKVYRVSVNEGLSTQHTAKQVHEFGVNVMDTIVIEGGKFLVVTGGDDQHICVSLYSHHM